MLFSEDLSDVGYVIEHMFNIYDKNGRLIPFRLNNIQRSIDAQIVKKGLKRSSILKYRQGGVTTYIMGWFLSVCMQRYAVCTMLAHDREHTEKLLQRAKLMLLNMNGPKPSTSKLNENEIFFSKTQSAFYIGTAGNVNFGRSSTITHLHCSEIAFWKDPKTLLTGLHQAVPHDTGVIIQETTANGFGTWFQKQFYRYIAGGARYKGFFFPWHIHEDYFSRTPLILPKTKDEEEIQAKYDLSDERLQWRREKIDELDGDEERFKQEYPLNYPEAFKATGGSLFADVAISEPDEGTVWVQESKHLWVLSGHPRPGYHYIFGADSAGGTGNDYAAIVGICIETREQVLQFRDRFMNPPAFGKKIIELGKRFNTAYLVPESNSHGLSTIAVIKGDYPLYNIYRNLLKTGSQVVNVPSYGYGWKTSVVTKPYMVGIGQRFAEDGFKLYDPVLVDELVSFSEMETGQLEGSGDHDDTAIAFMLACIGYLKVAKLLGKAEPQKVVPIAEKRVTVEDRMKKFRDEEGRYLIPFEEIVKEKRRRTSITGQLWRQ